MMLRYLCQCVTVCSCSLLGVICRCCLLHDRRTIRSRWKYYFRTDCVFCTPVAV